MMGYSMGYAKVGCLLVCYAIGTAGTGMAVAQDQPHSIPEPRSGIWEAHSLEAGKDRLSLLTLEVSHSRDEQGAPQFRFRGTLWAPDDSCRVDSMEGPSDDSRSLSVDCVGSGRKPDGRRLDVRFDQEGQEVVATWWRQGKSTTLRLQRPPQDPNTRLEGDWVLDLPNSRPHYVLHLYRGGFPIPAEFEDLNPDHLVATLDRFFDDGSNGSYGTPVGFLPTHNSNEFYFFWPNSSSSFVGKLDAQSQRLVGVCPGELCTSFSRVRAAHKQ
jgi:hypothetical protein